MTAFEKLRASLELFAKYGDAHEVAVAHDCFYCGTNELPMTPSDKAALQELGWDEHEDSWRLWV